MEALTFPASSVMTALRDALATLPFLQPSSSREGREFLVNRALVVNQIARELGLEEVAAEALEMLSICEKHERRGW